MRRCLLLLLPLLALWPVRADALSIRDILELTRAGLGDDVLLALIEVDPSVFPIDAATLKGLKAAGVSDRVIVAMVRSSRTPPPPLDPVVAPADPQEAPPPQVVVIEHHDAPVVREVPVAVPIYVPVWRTNSRERGNVRVDRWDIRAIDLRSGIRQQPIPLQPTMNGTLQPTSNGRGVTRPEPVFWGWGGTLRPDAWKPNPQ